MTVHREACAIVIPWFLFPGTILHKRFDIHFRTHLAHTQPVKSKTRSRNNPVVIVPEIFGEEGDWSLYYGLVEEMRTLHKENVRGSKWISWHEGAHLISKNPKGSPTFERVINRLCEYFKIQKESIGTRFNWYRDSLD